MIVWGRWMAFVETVVKATAAEAERTSGGEGELKLPRRDCLRLGFRGGVRLWLSVRTCSLRGRIARA